MSTVLVVILIVVVVLLIGGVGLVAGSRSRKARHGQQTLSRPGEPPTALDQSSSSQHTRAPSSLSPSSSSPYRKRNTPSETLEAPPAGPPLPGDGHALASAGQAAPPAGAVTGPEALKPNNLYGGMGKSRGLIGGYLKSLRIRPAVSESTWEELEEALLGADIGLATADMVLALLRERVKAGKLKDPADILFALKGEILSCFDSHGGAQGGADGGMDGPADGGVQGGVQGGARNGSQRGSGNAHAPVDRSLRLEEGAINVWLFAGVNGVGKTTTIGKIAMSEAAGGHSVMLAAGDTFRAAAGEQLAMWGERAGVEVVRGKEGGDPGAVVFDSIEKAKARGCDLVLADTAGRLHTNVNLVEELKKIHRVAVRAAGKVAEVLLVLDATTGQNGLAQARQFTDAVGITGVVLTKLDGTARGGIVVAIERELGIPVKLVGIGEGAGDLIPFDPVEFVEALFG
ncbi:MAG: signal recognition particle-docking protein FtsY [Acidimicrobiales bacterium]